MVTRVTFAAGRQCSILPQTGGRHLCAAFCGAIHVADIRPVMLWVRLLRYPAQTCRIERGVDAQSSLMMW